MAGLNFSNENEARHFADTVKGKLQNRLARRHGNNFVNKKCLLYLNSHFQTRNQITTQCNQTFSQRNGGLSVCIQIIMCVALKIFNWACHTFHGHNIQSLLNVIWLTHQWDAVSYWFVKLGFSCFTTSQTEDSMFNSALWVSETQYPTRNYDKAAKPPKTI